MFQRVLIVEDNEIMSYGLRYALGQLGAGFESRSYCDDAFLAMRKALETDEPFDLLITDLSFVEDHREQNISNGQDLIRAARDIQPGLKVLVFSIDNRPYFIESLFTGLKIDGYVAKARELTAAIEAIWKGGRHRPPALRQALKLNNDYRPTDLDRAILTLLSEGVRQKDIPSRLEEMQLKPSGLSSVEKRLSFLKEMLGCSQNEQLILCCKEKGII